MVQINLLQPAGLPPALQSRFVPRTMAQPVVLTRPPTTTTTSSEPEQAALRWHGAAAAPQRSFGRPPGAVGWMVAPSLHSPNVHTWLQGSCATVQPGPGHEPGEKVFLSPLLQPDFIFRFEIKYSLGSAWIARAYFGGCATMEDVFLMMNLVAF